MTFRCVAPKDAFTLYYRSKHEKLVTELRILKIKITKIVDFSNSGIVVGCVYVPKVT